MQLNYGVIDVTQIIAIARIAGDAIMKIYNRDFTVEYKDDKSPLTKADKVSNKLILDGLKKLYPDIPFISEETKLIPYAERKQWKQFWLIDPIDGTKEFIKKNGEFTVNIALVDGGVPAIGIVYAPALNKMYCGVKGVGSFTELDKQLSPIKPAETHYLQKQKVIVVGSRSHLTTETITFVDELKSLGKEVEFSSSGSSLKLCLVAESKADVYPRFGPTMEWDTAAAHAVALYAGRKVVNWETKETLHYNKENLLNPYFIVE